MTQYIENVVLHSEFDQPMLVVFSHPSPSPFFSYPFRSLAVINNDYIDSSTGSC